MLQKKLLYNVELSVYMYRAFLISELLLCGDFLFNSCWCKC